MPPEIAKAQQDLVAWEGTNWSGACDAEAKLAKPTLVITGTDDNNYMPHGNALILAGKIPGAWLVHIKDAGHAVMDQYPAEISKIMNTFQSTAGQNNVTSGNMTRWKHDQWKHDQWKHDRWKYDWQSQWAW